MRDNCDPCDSGASCSGAASNCPPSPIPPWHRPVQSPNTQTIVGNDNVSLTMDTTYLKRAASEGGPYAVTLPNGNFKRQIKRIYIPGDSIEGTAIFNLAGTFAGFTSLTFNELGTSAVLEWDGSAWQMIGGNAVVNP